MSATFVAVDLDSLQAALARAARDDRIVTAFAAGALRPLLGFADGPGAWHVAGWSATQPCGCWTVGADGEARCRVPRKSSTEYVRRWRAANPERARELSRDANRNRRPGAGWRKWAEIARRARDEDREGAG